MDAGMAELADDLFQVNENGPAQRLDVLANDVFGDGYAGARRITSVSYGSEGGRIETADDGLALRYTPPADFFGTETFDYYVDGFSSATVTVTVLSPLAFDAYEFPPDGQPRVLDVLANDPFWSGYDGARKITIVSETSLGSEVAIAADGGSLVYTPPRDAYGKDTFVYIVDDLYPTQVTVGIPNPLEHDGDNDRHYDIVQASERNVIDVLTNDPFWTGYPGDRTVTHVTEPTSGGTVAIASDGKTVIYTPPPDFHGRDHFTYVVDGVYEASVGLRVYRPVQDDRLEVDVNSTDHPLMVTANDFFKTRSGGRRDVVDRVTSVGEAAHGGTVEITADGRGILYSAPADFEGWDTFEYVADGTYSATVTVHVARPVRDDYFGDRRLRPDVYSPFVDDPPNTGSAVYEDTVDNVLHVLRNDFKGNGYQGPKIITSVSETSQGGIVTIGGGGHSLVYTPSTGSHGTDTFTYTVDGQFQANVRIQVKPIAEDDSFYFFPDPLRAEHVLDVLKNDHFGPHYSGPGLITAVSEPANGGSAVISDDGKSIRFVPAEGGKDRFTYTVDGKYEASVSVAFRDFLRGDRSVVDQNSSENELSPLANDFLHPVRDDSGHKRWYSGPRRITSVGECEQGGTVTVAADGETFLYTPARDFFGADRFTYTVDGLMQERVTVNVIRRVRDDVFRVEANSHQNALTVLVNDLFGANYSGPGRITAVTETTEGGTATVSEDGTSILYTPPAGFTGEDKFTYTVDGGLKAEVTVWAGASVEDVLPRFDSPADFQQFLLDGALKRYEHLFGSVQQRFPSIAPIIDFGGSFNTCIAESASLGTADSSRIYSQTNVQVAGVDEADIIETDGDYLYILTGGELIIAKAWPADEMSIVSRVSIDGQLMGEYLDGDRLTVISQKWEDDGITPDEPLGWPIGGIGRWWSRSYDTWVTVYDVSDRESPTIVRTTKLDGAHVESRRIDDSIFLVLRDDRVDSWLPEPNRELVGDSYVYETREQYIERVTADLESFLPHYTTYDANGELLRTGLLHAPEDMFQPLSPNARSLVTVVSLDTSAHEPGVSASTGIFTSGADKIYGSLDNLYVFDQQYTSEDRAVTQFLEFNWDAETGGVELAAQGQVPGRMLNQFSADQYDGYLRIATTVSNSRSGNWSGRSENVLFVLRDDGGVFEFVGSMQNLALGERIYSVRFLGDRAFITTFRNIDPLFAVDLSDPARPESRGHVTIPGFNSYMQLIDQNHLLAVGRNTAARGSGPTQVSLFDIEDLSRPRLIDQYTFERFSTSEAEADHHAFGWFGEHQTLAMPSARVYWERVDTDGDGYSETRSSVREDELFVFKIDVNATRQSGDGIQLLGGIEHDSPVHRSAFIEDVLYSIASDSVQAVSIMDPAVSFTTLDLHGRLDPETPAAGHSSPGVEEPFTATEPALPDIPPLLPARQHIDRSPPHQFWPALGVGDDWRLHYADTEPALAPVYQPPRSTQPEGSQLPHIAAVPLGQEERAAIDAVLTSVADRSVAERDWLFDGDFSDQLSIALWSSIHENWWRATSAEHESESASDADSEDRRQIRVWETLRIGEKTP